MAARDKQATEYKEYTGECEREAGELHECGPQEGGNAHNCERRADDNAEAIEFGGFEVELHYAEIVAQIGGG